MELACPIHRMPTKDYSKLPTPYLANILFICHNIAKKNEEKHIECETCFLAINTVKFFYMSFAEWICGALDSNHYKSSLGVKVGEWMQFCGCFSLVHVFLGTFEFSAMVTFRLPGSTHILLWRGSSLALYLNLSWTLSIFFPHPPTMRHVFGVPNNNLIFDPIFSNCWVAWNFATFWNWLFSQNWSPPPPPPMTWCMILLKEVLYAKWVNKYKYYFL